MLDRFYGWPGKDAADRTERARRRADEFAALLASPKSPRLVPLAQHPHGDRTLAVSGTARHRLDPGWRRLPSTCAALQRQAVQLVRSFHLLLPAALNEPGPFAALLRYGKLPIASSSPERFLKLDGRQVETRPIKGTIARPADA
uniref:chorismate-binding protein n=1 Tax=Bradyrhizobium niftali TaxID=2560055 RepID=UPI00384B780B